jgi:DNA-binding MurR/RpiR family transcriptional regulator
VDFDSAAIENIGENMSVEALISTQVIDTTSVGRSIMTAADAAAVRTAADAQVTLVSGTNIKTVNSTSLLGSGDIAVVLSWVWDATGGLIYSVWKQLQ